MAVPGLNRRSGLSYELARQEQSRIDGYYLAALQYLDPRLDITATTSQINAAARQRLNMAGSSAEAGDDESSRINEALQFALKFQHRSGQEPGLADSRGSSRQKPEIRIAQPVTHRRNRIQAINRETRLAEISPPDCAGSATETMPAEPLETDIQVSTRLPARILPEQAAWPLATGLLLLAWELWLVLFGGWTAIRLLHWPAPFSPQPFGTVQLAVCTLAAIVAATGVGWFVRSYRVRTAKLAGLVHLSALLIMADIGAWWLASLRSGGQIPVPGNSLLVLVSLAWLITVVSVWFVHDARLRVDCES